mgnify:CR=1 FL=1
MNGYDKAFLVVMFALLVIVLSVIGEDEGKAIEDCTDAEITTEQLDDIAADVRWLVAKEGGADDRVSQ